MKFEKKTAQCPEFQITFLTYLKKYQKNFITGNCYYAKRVLTNKQDFKNWD